MGYTGNVVPIPMGQGGLSTDDTQSIIPPTKLIVANNVMLVGGVVEKMGGSTRLNQVPIPDGVLCLFDFWPTTAIGDRKVVALGGDGKTYAVNTSGTTTTEITGAAPATLVGVTNQAVMLECGKEAAANNKKLFIFTANNQVQVISGTAMVRTAIATPAADWAASFPTFGLAFRGRVVAGGNDNQPHTLYISLATNHEDFASGGTATIGVFPGEGDRLLGGMIYKGELFVFKYPFGAYKINISADPNDPAKWYAEKLTDSFGFASPHSVISAMDDVLLKDASDRIVSVAATQAFGDVTAGDALNILRIEQYVRDQTNADGIPKTHAIYYPEKRLAMFTYQSTSANKNDRILMFRLDTGTQPKASFVTKDEPNCLALRRDSKLIERPMYGSLDEYIYLMDQDGRNVNGQAYIGEFQTPHMDFGFLDPKAAIKNKHFHFLDLRYTAEDDATLFIEVIIDGNVYQTIQTTLSADDLLAETLTDSDRDFMLADSATDPDGSFLAGEDTLSKRITLAGMGRTVSFRFYNTGLNESFRISMLAVSFKMSGEQVTKGGSSSG